MDNLNKLQERDVSLQDLVLKADYLSQNALNLNLTSVNIKKQKVKSNVKIKLLIVCLIFFFASAVYSYFIYYGLYRDNLKT